MRKILKWIGIVFGVLLALEFSASIIWGLIKDPIETLILLLFIGLVYGYIDAFVHFLEYCSSRCRFDQQSNKSLKRLKNGMSLSCGLMSICTFLSVGTWVFFPWDSYNALVVIIKTSISSILLTSFLFYAYVRFVKARNNALFLVRSCFSLLIVGLVRVIYSSIGGRVDTLIEITSLSFGKFIAMQFILVMVLSLSIKGLMITFGNEANKVFPKSQRTIPFHDILIVLLLVLYLVLINAMDFTW